MGCEALEHKLLHNGFFDNIALRSFQAHVAPTTVNLTVLCLWIGLECYIYCLLEGKKK